MDRKLVECIIRVSIITFSLTFQSTILLWVTPSANRNTYSVAIIVGYLTQGSVLSPATLGYVIATPTELPRVRTINDGLI